MSDEWQKDRETCERATEGPWVTSVVLLDGKPLDAVYQDAVDGDDGFIVASLRGIRQHLSKEDATFIARARTRWPAALDRIAELEAEVRTAYARGFEAAKKAAVDAVQSVAYITANGARPYADREDAVTAIRAVKMGEGKP